MIRIKHLFYVLAIFTALSLYPCSNAYAGDNCGPLKEILKKEFTSGFSYMSSAITNFNIPVLFFINTKNRAWEIIGIQDENNACILARGSDWGFAAEKGI